MLGLWGLGGDELAGVRVDVVEVVVVVVVVVGVVRWHLLDAGGDAPHRLHVRLRGRPAPRPPPFGPPSPPGSHAVLWRVALWRAVVRCALVSCCAVVVQRRSAWPVSWCGVRAGAWLAGGWGVWLGVGVSLGPGCGGLGVPLGLVGRVGVRGVALPEGLCLGPVSSGGPGP